jgi:hypothetical protein
MAASPQHRHDEFHRGTVPAAQLAAGTPAEGTSIVYESGIPTWDTVSPTGQHQHWSEVFAGDGSTVDFVLTQIALSLPLVALNGSIQWDGWDIDYPTHKVTFVVAPPNGSQVYAYYDYAP